MKIRNKRKIVVATVLYVAVLLSVLAASYAWFINNREVSVSSGENMTITVGNKLEISQDGDVIGDSEWGSSINVGTGEKVCPDISGDGINFYYPMTLSVNDMPTYDIPANFRDINASERPDDYFILVKLKFRTSTPMDVYLSNESDITGKNLDRLDDLSGNASSGIIAGAIRVGFSEETHDPETETTTEELKSIWIPNDRYQLVTDEKNNVLTYDLEGEREQFYSYLSPNNGTMNEETETVDLKNWTEDDFASGKILVGKDMLASNTDGVVYSNGGKPILSFECANGHIEERVLIIRIWVEGTDREAHTNLNGGQLSYNLDFIGISKNDYTAEDSAAYEEIRADATLGLCNASGEALDSSIALDYSFNGIDWAAFDPSNTTDFVTALQEKGSVYVRMSESLYNKPTKYKKLSLSS